MINDLQLVYLWDAPLATTTNSDIVDILGGGGRGFCDPLRFTITQTGAAAGGTAVTVALQTSDTVDFSSPTVLTTTAALTTSTTSASVLASFATPSGMKRYSRVVITPTGTFTAGTISVFITYAEEFSFQELGTFIS